DMKLIVRADDLGYCRAVNYGIEECIRDGIVTTVELMADMPGSEHGAEIVKQYPAVSAALHCHFQGKACAPLEKIPSITDENGMLNIRSRKKLKPDYRPDLDEMFIEYRAQLDRFVELVGRLPDYLKPIGPNASRMKTLAKELGIPTDYRGGYELGMKPIYPDKEWEYLDYYTVPVMLTDEDEKMENQAKLNSVDYFLQDKAGILSNGHQVVEMVMHPGWLDDYVLRHSSFSIIRLKDLEALKSPLVKAWVRDHGIQLVSAYDALHGTDHYQRFYERKEK
uniref:ChbG/HpnK family deacetylase n=2 Tax=Hungatella effluvii TaxID=1096246 RepID=UPI002A832F72